MQNEILPFGFQHIAKWNIIYWHLSFEDKGLKLLLYHFILFFFFLRSKYDYKFLPLQYAIDTAIMQMQAALSHGIPVKMKASI